MAMSVPVVIVQTSISALTACGDELQAAGLVLGREYALFNSPEASERLIVEGAHQMLVIGTIHGDELATASFVKKVKPTNPEMKVVFFSSLFDQDDAEELSDTYDEIVEKGQRGNLCSHLLPVMRRFIAEGVGVGVAR